MVPKPPSGPPPKALLEASRRSDTGGTVSHECWEDLRQLNFENRQRFTASYEETPAERDERERQEQKDALGDFDDNENEVQ